MSKITLDIIVWVAEVLPIVPAELSPNKLPDICSDNDPSLVSRVRRQQSAGETPAVHRVYISSRLHHPGITSTPGNKEHCHARQAL